ncbi:MAG: pyridoxal-phosphate dependent enzyme [Myxococcales bacterium]|nr:pyridoxal-phosphate dependent enzyme [Myxococcales bacterium]
MPQRLSLLHRPTPLEPLPRLGEALGLDLWVKRDDATGGAEAGNKIRKLELLLADALEQGADTVITCGGLQSNHARATALLAARLDLRCLLMLRDSTLDDDGQGAGLPLEGTSTGNAFLGKLAGAEIRRVTRDSYARRDEVLAGWADELRSQRRRPYVIGEGGSSGLGALGYVEAMGEVHQALDAMGAAPFDLVVHACGSGGTSAGLVLGAGQHGVAREVVAFAVCDDAPTFEAKIAAIVAEARPLAPAWLAHPLAPPVPLTVDDSAKGPAYGVPTEAQLRDMVRATRLTGLVFDPVYTGKAIHGLMRRAGGWAGMRVLFLHTGGLPGLLADPAVFDCATATSPARRSTP